MAETYFRQPSDNLYLFFRLTQLSLSNTKITDDGMKRLTGKIVLFFTELKLPSAFQASCSIVYYAIDHFTVVAELPGLRMEARLPVTLF